MSENIYKNISHRLPDMKSSEIENDDFDDNDDFWLTYCWNLLVSMLDFRKYVNH